MIRTLPYTKLRNYLYSAMGEIDARKIVLLGLTELPLTRIRECHRLVLGALAAATPKDPAVGDEHPEEEDSRRLARAVVLAAQAERWEPGQHRVGA